MKYVLCPPCGTVFEGETEQDLIRTTQQHSKEKHDYLPPADEVRKFIRATPPPADDTVHRSQH